MIQLKIDENSWLSILYRAIKQAVKNGYTGTYSKMEIEHCRKAIDVPIDDEPFFYNIIFEPEFARYFVKNIDIPNKWDIVNWQIYLCQMSIQETYEDKFKYLEQFIQ